MKIFDANISDKVLNYFKININDTISLEIANKNLFDLSGIVDFFDDITEFVLFNNLIANESSIILKDDDRAEYGDFQTNSILSNKIVNRIFEMEFLPDVLIEPTCGKGNFIISALSKLKSIKKIYGVEIYKKYIWETKFKVIDFFLSNKDSNKPEIHFSHCSIFDFNLKSISKDIVHSKILILGNPPWVTNSKLSSLNSSNLPNKSNFKMVSGIDAITGKGNFDIGESIMSMHLDVFQNFNGYLIFLVKNSVIKNIVYNQKQKNYRISNIKKYSIDSKKEFNASVEASLFTCKLNSNPDYKCEELDFYTLNSKSIFGWLNSKFVSNIAFYEYTKTIDGTCPFEWRQGIKHDCSSIMELERVNGHFINNKSEEIYIEEDLVFGFLKSSDLKNTVINKTRKHTIVTQSKVGEDTSYIKDLYPYTYSYLNKNLSIFEKRKSSIYNGKPPFSIFGIGKYSFKPYKVAISSLYKSFHFTLVLPLKNKSVMLDDTCYFIGFNKIEYAVYSLILLNSKLNEEFLKSITFSDAKRVFTKEILMRIDLKVLANLITIDEITQQIDFLNLKYNINIDLTNWENYIIEMEPEEQNQLAIF